MSELMIIGTIFDSIQKEKNLNRQRLMEILATRKINGQVESPELIESLVTRLIKMHVLAGNVDSDGDFSLETFMEKSTIFQSIIKLRNLYLFSRDFNDFKDYLLSSELNQHFIDENEMKRVYSCMKREVVRGSFDY